MKIEIPNKKILLVANIIFLCIIAGMMFFSGQKTDNSDGVITRDVNNEYKLTNPILDYEDLSSGNNSAIPVGLINNKIDDLKEQSGLSHISLYYRDLNNGQWIGIEEKEEFSPASLLKVPVLIAFLKQAESDDGLLEKRVVFVDQDFGSVIKQNITPEEKVITSKEYSLLDIAKIMIKNSDNDAAAVLIKEIKPEYIEGVFKSIGVPYVDSRTETNVRVKDYAGFFRVLYNASYLNRDMSELALSLLVESGYDEGISKFLPKEILVANKFGERKIAHLNNGVEVLDETQLHDCGIIYYPKSPYILCVMTRGKDLKDQEIVIQELSKFVYREIES